MSDTDLDISLDSLETESVAEQIKKIKRDSQLKPKPKEPRDPKGSSCK